MPGKSIHLCMDKFNVIVVLSIIAAALFGGAMVSPALAQENISMPMDQMGNMTMSMENSTDMGNGTVTVN